MGVELASTVGSSTPALDWAVRYKVARVSAGKISCRDSVALRGLWLSWGKGTNVGWCVSLVCSGSHFATVALRSRQFRIRLFSIKDLDL